MSGFEARMDRGGIMSCVRAVFFFVLATLVAAVGHAQTAAPQSNGPQSGSRPEPNTDTSFETIVVTASPGTTTEFRSSVSVNSISVDEVAKYAPRGTAEIFRNIPGVRSEAGGGNAGNA